MNKIIGSIYILAVLALLAGAASAQTNISIGSGSAAPGGTLTLPLMINNVTDVGTFDVNLTYNASVVHVVSVVGVSPPAGFDFVDSNIDNATGVTRIGALQMGSAGLNGDVKVADVTLMAAGAEGSSSTINITINELKDDTPAQNVIPASVVNGTFSIMSVVCDPNPPVVTSPSANPKVVDDTGIIHSTLNVTVTDETSIASVTVNLSSIGGSSVHPMTNVPGTNVWTAQSGAFAAGVHNLQVNATDTCGNSNTSAAIQLIAVRLALITIGNATVVPGGTVTLPLMINNVSSLAKVATADINLMYNASVVHVTKVANSKFDFMDSIINNASGVTRIGAMQMMNPGMSGNVKLADVTLQAVGPMEASSVLGLVINELKDDTPGQNTIPAGVLSGFFKIAEAAPPAVSNPNAAPSAIPDDTDNNPTCSGTMCSEVTSLNVSAADASGVAGVTINLSAIGKSSVQPMTLIAGDSFSGTWSATANASAGKAGLHSLQVNATDVWGNPNTSVSITLRVVLNGDANNDGYKTLADATYLAKVALGKPGFVLTYPAVGDVNGDCAITFADATFLAKNALFKPGWSPLK